MTETKRGHVAVIFVNRRNDRDHAGYATAAQAMNEEAARQPGYVGVESVRNEEGKGITISFWEDEAAAIAWREHATHSAIRNQGRADWYDYYQVIVTTVSRSYCWMRNATEGGDPVTP